VAYDLYARVEKASAAAGANMAPWLRHMVRQIAIMDFPASWQEERLETRSYDSRIFGTRFMLRLDGPSRTKLQGLVEHFGVSKAELIRQLIAQATPDDFPKSWHMKVNERRMQQER
jgi:hypothetical protein